jgi:hypothetical protein
MSSQGRKLAVDFGTAWIVGRCTIHLDAEGAHPSIVSIRALTEPRDGLSHSESEFSEFHYDLAHNDPYVAATMVLRWVHSREGD